MNSAEHLAMMGVDGEKWADEFCRLGGRAADFDVVRGWFANAIEAGRSEGYGSVLRSLAERPDQIEPLDVLVQSVAVSALGRLSVSMFQPARHGNEGDYLTMRDGSFIGYGELAEKMAAAVAAELADRRAE